MFGFNARWSLGIEAAGGSFPNPSDRAERAAAAIGQGRVLASPVQMASVAATVANGRWRTPALVTEPAAPAASAVAALDPRVDSTLKSFMASVVRPGGTAAGAGLPANAFGNVGFPGFSFPFVLLLAGLGAFILAEVFAYGVRLREDVEGTV